MISICHLEGSLQLRRGGWVRREETKFRRPGKKPLRRERGQMQGNGYKEREGFELGI